MAPSNAQAALAAATSVYSMTDGDVNPRVITGMAAQFKRWLDTKDAEDLAAVAVPEVSHHISCDSRKVLNDYPAPCTCTPVPYTPENPHYTRCGCHQAVAVAPLPPKPGPFHNSSTFNV